MKQKNLVNFILILPLCEGTKGLSLSLYINNIINLFIEGQCKRTEKEYAEIEEKFKSLNTSLEEIDRLYQKQTDLEKENANAQQLIQKLTKEQSIAENELSKLLSKVDRHTKEYNEQLNELDITYTKEGKSLQLKFFPKASSLDKMSSIDLKRIAIVSISLLSLGLTL